MDWLMNPIANVLGYILEYIDKFVYFITELMSGTGLHSTGVCIILFVFVVNILMLPLTIKQQKTTKKDILQTTLYDLPDISLFYITLLIQFHNHQSIPKLSWQSLVISDIPKNFFNIQYYLMNLTSG